MAEIVGSVSEVLQCVWKIPDFFRMTDNCSKTIRSPNITYLRGRWLAYVISTTDGKVIIAVESNDWKTAKKSVKCNIGTERLKLCEPPLAPLVLLAQARGGLWSFAVSLDELKRRKSELIPSDTLNITFYVGDDVQDPRRLMALENLSSSFEDLFVSKKKTDATIKMLDKEFGVHRAVLVARSSIFSAMFGHDTSEEQTGVVTVPDCDPDSFQEFLHYLYTGKFDGVTSSNAHHLYATSDKYDVQELKSFCVHHMKHNLTVENVLDVVVLANWHEELELLSIAEDFFNQNFVDVISTCRWMTLMKEDSELANRLLLQMGQRSKVPKLDKFPEMERLFEGKKI